MCVLKGVLTRFWEAARQYDAPRVSAIYASSLATVNGLPTRQAARKSRMGSAGVLDTEANLALLITAPNKNKKGEDNDRDIPCGPWPLRHISRRSDIAGAPDRDVGRFPFITASSPRT
jgi:hypothetical protein